MTKKLTQVYRPETKIGRFLLVILLSGIAYGLYKGVQDNYFAQIAKINEFERGLLEFFRELPGLLVIFMLAACYRFTNSRVFKIGNAIMLAGLLGLFFMKGESKALIIVFVVLFSVGEHLIMPIKNTIALNYAQQGKGGVSLGIVSSISHGGNIIGFLVVTGLFMVLASRGVERTDILGFRIIFGVAVALMTGALLVSFGMKETASTVSRRRLYFSRKFTKYYMLEVFYGSRKQIFMTFAPYVLILQYGADTSLISLLLAICAGFAIVISPMIGRLIDRVGYKIIMVTDTLLLVIVCFFYGFSHRLFSMEVAFIVVCINYVLDSIISLASMASSVYVQDIASSKEEITATLSTGISVNHLISILIALFGGWIWQVTGIEVLFSISAVLGLLNTAYAATIKTPQKK